MNSCDTDAHKALGRAYGFARRQAWLYDLEHDSMRAQWRQLAHLMLRVACRVSAARYRMRRRHWGAPGEVHLNLGSGRYPVRGWVNVDINPFSQAEAWIDLRDPWPFRDGEAAAIYSRHCLEHFTEHDGLHILRESYRVLRPGGGIRIGVPCLERALFLYEHGGFPTWVAKQAESPGRRFFAYIMDNGNHQVIFDYTYLAELLAVAGFVDVQRMPAGESGIVDKSMLAVADTSQDDGTLYVEGRRN